MVKKILTRLAQFLECKNFTASFNFNDNHSFLLSRSIDSSIDSKSKESSISRFEFFVSTHIGGATFACYHRTTRASLYSRVGESCVGVSHWPASLLSIGRPFHLKKIPSSHDFSPISFHSLLCNRWNPSFPTTLLIMLSRDNFHSRFIYIYFQHFDRSRNFQLCKITIALLSLYSSFCLQWEFRDKIRR